MRPSPLLLFHICSGLVALLSGAAAMWLQKGSRRHIIAGNIFVISMLALSTTGSFMGWVKHHLLNVAMGALAFYLVATAWLTARRKSKDAGIFDCCAFLVPVAIGSILVSFGIAVANRPVIQHGYPAAVYLIYGSVALLFAAGDVRMLRSDGLSGAHRIARHLSRMCFALFVAATSIFQGEPQVFPEALRKSGLLFLPSIVPLIVMICWLFRLRFTGAYAKMSLTRGSGIGSLRT
jgi:uncharacterized membrane protein